MKLERKVVEMVRLACILVLFAVLFDTSGCSGNSGSSDRSDVAGIPATNAEEKSDGRSAESSAAGTATPDSDHEDFVKRANQPDGTDTRPAVEQPGSNSSKPGVTQPSTTTDIADSKDADDAKRVLGKRYAEQYGKQQEKVRNQAQQDPPSAEEIRQQQENVAAKALSVAKEQLQKGRTKRARLLFANIVSELPDTKAAQEAKKLLEEM